MKGSVNPKALNLGLKEEKSCSRPAVLWDYKLRASFPCLVTTPGTENRPTLWETDTGEGLTSQFGRKQPQLKMENSSNYLVSQPHVKFRRDNIRFTDRDSGNVAVKWAKVRRINAANLICFCSFALKQAANCCSQTVGHHRSQQTKYGAVWQNVGHVTDAERPPCVLPFTLYSPYLKTTLADSYLTSLAGLASTDHRWNDTFLFSSWQGAILTTMLVSRNFSGKCW